MNIKLNITKPNPDLPTRLAVQTKQEEKTRIKEAKSGGHSLLDMANRIKDGQPEAKKILIYGLPDTGKTHLAGTIAKELSIKQVIWFDLEGGAETLVYAHTSEDKPLLTASEMEKISLIRIEDTKEFPLAAETILKTFTARDPIKVCLEHGSTACKKCGISDTIMFNLRSQSLDTAIVIDSGSQLADSILSVSMLANSYKDLRQHYGDFNMDMGAIVSAIQAAPCHIVFVTHELDLLRDKLDARGNKVGEVLVQTVPLAGSRNFSKKFGKAFGYKIYTYKNGAMRQATTEFKDKVLTGNRKPVYLKGLADPSLTQIFSPEVTKPEKKAGPTPKIG